MSNLKQEEVKMIRKSLLMAMAVLVVASVGFAEVKAKVLATSDIIDIATPVSSAAKTTVKAGDEITIVATMKVDNASGLAATLLYDGKQLKFVKVKKGDALKDQGLVAISTITHKSPDRLAVRIDPMNHSLSGTGEVFVITLKAIKDGEAKIDFVDMDAYASMINNSAMPQRLSFNIR